MAKNDLIDLFTPKRLIFEAVKEKLQGKGINKISFIYVIDKNEYHVMLSQANDKPLQLEVGKDEISLLKRFVIGKIKRKIDQEMNIDYTTMIFQMDLVNDKIDVFIEDIFKNVHKVNY
jgi:hypothetical protein